MGCPLSLTVTPRVKVISQNNHNNNPPDRFSKPPPPKRVLCVFSEKGTLSLDISFIFNENCYHLVLTFLNMKTLILYFWLISLESWIKDRVENGVWRVGNISFSFCYIKETLHYVALMFFYLYVALLNLCFNVTGMN